MKELFLSRKVKHNEVKEMGRVGKVGEWVRNFQTSNIVSNIVRERTLRGDRPFPVKSTCMSESRYLFFTYLFTLLYFLYPGRLTSVTNGDSQVENKV